MFIGVHIVSASRHNHRAHMGWVPGPMAGVGDGAQVTADAAAETLAVKRLLGLAGRMRRRWCGGCGPGAPRCCWSAATAPQPSRHAPAKSASRCASPCGAHLIRIPIPDLEAQWRLPEHPQRQYQLDPRLRVREHWQQTAQSLLESPAEHPAAAWPETKGLCCCRAAGVGGAGRYAAGGQGGGGAAAAGGGPHRGSRRRWRE